MMNKKYLLWLLVLVVLVFQGQKASANLGDYIFEATTGTPIALGEGSELSFSNGTEESFDDGVSDVLDIGFTFYFDGVPYTKYSVSTNGVVGLGPNAITSCWGNDLTRTSGDCFGNTGYPWEFAPTPRIAPFWDDQRVTDVDGFWSGSVTSTLVGNAPNRILVISFNNVEISYFSELFGTYQVRLYEGSNRVEIYYEDMSDLYFNDGASIGIAVNESNFLSVSPGDGGDASVSSTEVNNEYYPSDFPIPPGTLYTFTPCNITIDGDIAEGGTETMASGDTLLLGMSAELFNTVIFRPITISAPAACGEKTFTISVEGDEYSVSPTEGVAGPDGTLPEISFTPVGPGRRLGIITITDDRGGVTFYYLAAEGLPRIAYEGNVGQGGTATMQNGDILLNGIHVRRGLSENYTPFTVINTSENSEAPPASVTFSLRGLSGGQYSITPTTVNLGSGESITPTITFTPTGVGPIRDTLYVTADGETRAFALNAISDAIGAQFTAGSEILGPGTQVFSNRYSCVGATGDTLPLVVNNIGNLPFRITRLEIYRTDTSYGQGQPSYRLLRDQSGNLIPATDYTLSATPGGEPLTLPVTLQPGETRPLYLNFVGAAPGKRFARAFLYTNDEVASGIDMNGEEVQGLRTFDLFGRGLGGKLAGDMEGNRLRHVVFPRTDVGKVAEQTLSIYNPGQCDLRISMRDLRITGGDVDEFAIVSAPPANDGTDLVIAPGQRADFTFRFSPKRSGSRRATVLLRTNDATLQVPGITEPGAFYLNLYGGAETGLYLDNVAFGQALIGGTAADQKHNIARLTNTSSTPVMISSIMIEGTDAGEFAEDPTRPWPSLPRLLQPGEELELGVVFAPATGGQPGGRGATLKLVIDGKDVTAQLTGEAGTRTATANPGSISFPVTTTGKYQRRTVSITNDGTMPVTLTNVEVMGPDAANFQIGKMERMELAPGATEYIEVTYVPTAPGTVNATLEFDGNMTNGPAQVLLGGTSVKSKPQDNDPSIALPGRRDVIENGVGRADGLEELSLSGVESNEAVSGMTLSQSVPNPAQHSAEIRYSLVNAAQVELSLYDAQGRLVRVLDAGNRTAGEQTVRVNVSDLANGTYFYRLTTGGRTLSRSLQVMR